MKAKCIFAIILFTIIFNAHSAENVERNYNIQPYGLKCSILSTPQEHKDAFTYALRTAKKSILITGYGYIQEDFGKYGPYSSLLNEAKERGVRIYSKWTQNGTEFPEHLKSLLKSQVDINIHAKILLVDYSLLILGSFNWFGDLHSLYAPLNRSFKIEGRGLFPLKETIWEAVNDHQNKELPGYFKRPYAYKRIPANKAPHVLKLNANTTLSYLSTVEAHCSEWGKWFKKAKNRIVIMSPFVSEECLSKDFELIDSVLQRGVHLVFICQNNDKELLFAYFDQYISNPYFHLIFKDDIHAKTAIIDSDLIAEGSFNWLQTARSERSYNYKHEATVVCHGTEAAKFINDFYKTDLGKEINHELTQEIRQQSVLGKRKLADSVENHFSTINERPDEKKYQRLNFAQGYHNRGNIDWDIDRDLDEFFDEDIADEEFFAQGMIEADQELWIDSPSWVELNDRYMCYEKYIEVMKDNKGYLGWCVRYNKKEYIREKGQIKYFDTSDEAKKAAFISRYFN